MFRPASRLITRSQVVRALPRAAAPARRFLSTAPPTQKSRSWKSLVARLGIAGAIIYYYNTTDVFAEEPRHLVQPLPETENETEQLPTIDALAQERQQRKAQAAAAAEKASDAGAQQTTTAGGVEGLEEEADQQGAFNPETGEINWDCPCLGGMAHGPCGEEFKAAFSCFVYSTDEPKGMDCIDKFKDMQTCFRQYPEIYGSELDTDEEDDMTADAGQLHAADSASLESTSEPSSSEPSTQKEKVGAAAPKKPSQPSADAGARQQRAQAATEQVQRDHGDADKQPTGAANTKPKAGPGDEKPQDKQAKADTEQGKSGSGPLSESDDLVPKAWHDETAANDKVRNKAVDEKN